MWYGRQAFAGLKELALTDILKKITDDGYFPEVESSNYRKPLLPWKNQVTRCWSQAPTNALQLRNVTWKSRKIMKQSLDCDTRLDSG